MIPKMEREQKADRIIKQLPKTWNKIKHLVLQLQDTSRSYITTELLMYRDEWKNMYDFCSDFLNDHRSWFSTNWPDYNTALTGILTSLDNINNIINTGVQTHYWDPDTDKPVIAEISQPHRNNLASNINAELE